MSQTRKKLYWERKLAGLCVDCAAGLQEDDGVRCVECSALEVRRQLKYKATPNGRAVYNAAARRRHRERAGAGACVDCCKPTRDRRRCGGCRARRKEWQASTDERRAQRHGGVG